MIASTTEKRPKPMPTTYKRRSKGVWPRFASANVESYPWPGEEPSLADAVGSIVRIAAQRARASGTLDALRDAVEAALQTAPQAGEAGAPPRRADADPSQAPLIRGGLTAGTRPG